MTAFYSAPDAAKQPPAMSARVWLVELRCGIIFADEIHRPVSGTLAIIRTASPAVTTAPQLLRRQTPIPSARKLVYREKSGATVAGGL
jgi:hypothetical protein